MKYHFDQPHSAKLTRDDYTYTPGIGAHKFHTKAVNWTTAREICESEGAHLAVINSDAEAKVISELYKKSVPHLTGIMWKDIAHIGFHDFYVERNHVTIHDEPLKTAGFDKWHSGEPNNWGAGGENCGSITVDGKLNDIYCRAERAFICELRT